jgi:hypothetical protein
MYLKSLNLSPWRLDLDGPFPAEDCCHFGKGYFPCFFHRKTQVNVDKVHESAPNVDRPINTTTSAESLCSRCSKINISALLSAAETEDGKPLRKVVIGPPGEIDQSRARCRFCRLVWKHYTLNRPSNDHDIVIYIKSTNLPSGVRQGSSAASCNGKRLKIYYEKSRVAFSKCCFLELQVLPDLALTTSSFNLEQSQAGSLARRTSFSGRLLDSNQIDFNLPKFWLSQCSVEHESRCDHTQVFKHLKNSESIFVIDVDRNCIVKGSVYSPYAALSYVWGNRKNLTHTKANSKLLQQRNALSRLPIPATIEDAIFVTKGMGLRYLWVDSLCIIQNSTHKYSQIKQMASIYANATFTIVDGIGRTCEAGLPGVRRNTRIPRQEKICIQGTHFVTVIESSDPVAKFGRLRQSAWWSRGWTLQEFLFSSRLLIFTEDQLHWHCDNADWLEETVLENTERARTQDMRHLARQSRADFNGPSLRSLFRLRSNDIRTMESRCYPQLVQEYKRRLLSFDTDVLHAITGLLDAKEKRCSYRFHWGLPEQLFSESLSWIDEGAQRTLVEGRMSHSQPSCPVEPIPSWSWAAWKGKPNDFGWLCTQKQRIQSEVEFYRWDGSESWKVVDERRIGLVDQRSMREAEWKGKMTDASPLEHQQLSNCTGILKFWASRAKVVIRRTTDPKTSERKYEILPPFKYSRDFKGVIEIHLGNTEHMPLAENESVPIYDDLNGDDEIFEAYLIVYGRLFESADRDIETDPHGLDWIRTNFLVALVVEYRDDVAYRLGVAVVSEADWVEIMKNEWRLITLG